MAGMGTPKDPDTPKLVRLTDGLHVRQEIDNIAWADVGDALLVIDALERPELQREVFDMLERTAPGKPVRWVLNTHTHHDHIALNEAFRTRFHATIINRRTADMPPEGRWFEGGGRRVHMVPMPGCHTDDDCIVWLPDDRTLFVGDIFGWGLIPWDRPLTAEKRDLLFDCYATLIELNADTVVPGHGPLCSTCELRRWVEYFGWLIEAVSGAMDKGLDEDDIRENVVPPPADMYTWWRFLQWKHDDSVAKILHAVKRGALE